MEALNQTSRFRYNTSNSEGDIEFSGILEIFVHHARNIHNICIYDNQDVYAKFSLTYNPDETVSTRVINGGGKNPDFGEKLELKVNQIDSILKCEIWMLSRARNFMEDQLLGFALVPIPLIFTTQGGKLICQDFSLSSTDLFHSPAGTVQLSLSFSSPLTSSVLSSSVNPLPNFSANSSISSEVILLDPNEYSKVEFPDINVATENQIMVSQYYNSNPIVTNPAAFLHLGCALKTEDDCEMIGNSSKEDENPGVSNTQFDNTNRVDLNSIDENSQPSSNGDQTPETGVKQSKNMDFEADQVAMQQQIMDMYMKSMHQFTESLAKMKLPMDLDPNPDDEDHGKVIRVMERSSKLEVEKKKDGSRVFYGSRAFF